MYSLPSCNPSEVSEHIHRRHTAANEQGSFSTDSVSRPNFVEAVNTEAMKEFIYQQHYDKHNHSSKLDISFPFYLQLSVLLSLSS